MFEGASIAIGVYLTIKDPGLLAWRLLAEERYLREHLPGYVAYTRKVRYRLVPRVW